MSINKMKLYPPSEAAKMLKISVGTLWVWMRDGKVPKPLRLNKYWFFNAQEIKAIRSMMKQEGFHHKQDGVLLLSLSEVADKIGISNDALQHRVNNGQILAPSHGKGMQKRYLPSEVPTVAQQVKEVVPLIQKNPADEAEENGLLSQSRAAKRLGVPNVSVWNRLQKKHILPPSHLFKGRLYWTIQEVEDMRPIFDLKKFQAANEAEKLGLLSKTRAAHRLGVATSTINYHIKTMHLMPPSHLFKGCMYFKVEEIEEFRALLFPKDTHASNASPSPDPLSVATPGTE